MDISDELRSNSDWGLADTLWRLMADLSEADRWCYTFDTQTGELYIEDAVTLKRYFQRAPETAARKNRDARFSEH